MSTAYRSLGLGALLVQALQAAVTDPTVRDQAQAATDKLNELTTKVDGIATALEENGELDDSQSDDLASIQEELQGLASALTPQVIASVEQPQSGGDTAAEQPVDNAQNAADAASSSEPPAVMGQDTTDGLDGNAHA